MGRLTRVRRGTRTAVVLACVLAGVPLAAQPLPGFRLVQATPSIDFFARPDAPVRPREAEAAERFLADVRGRLGVADGGARVAYYRVGHPVDVAALVGLVGRDADGFTDEAGRRIVSARPVHRHELVHAAAAGLGDPGRFFHEGLAVALAGDKDWRGGALDRAAGTAVARTRLRSFVDGFEARPAAEAYAVAGSFISHLIRRHGLQPVAAFFRSCADRRTPRDGAFRAAFGRSLEEAESEWRAAL